MMTCKRCGAVVTERGHRHRVSVRVPIRRVVDGRTCDSFERVTVVVDVGDVAHAIERAMQRVHGPDATWIVGAEGDRGCVGRRRRGSRARMVVDYGLPAPVIEWDGGDL